MNKIVYGLAAAAVMLSASEAGAQTRPGFEVGAEVFDYGYRERFEGQEVAADDGLFLGLSGAYTQRIGAGFFLRGRLSVAFGSVDYRSEQSGSIDGVAQTIGQLELHLGRDFPVGDGATLTPFLGVGGRVLEDESGGEATDLGALGYDRKISYSYVPLGLAATLPVGGDTRLSLSGQYNLLLEGEAESRFSAIDPSFPDVRLHLPEGSGLEASAMVAFPAGGGKVAVGPFVRRWDIAQSDTFVITDPEGSGESVELLEPENRTTEFGIRLAYQF